MGLTGLWFLLFTLSLCLGSANIPINQVLAILFFQDSESTQVWQEIVWQLRFPRAIAATFAGAALGLGGIQMQTLFSNPLAGPFVLGINSGAGLGVVTAAGFGCGLGFGLPLDSPIGKVRHFFFFLLFVDVFDIRFVR